MRRTVEAPYERGETTRAGILEVAIELFGTHGFDSISTRKIAAAAGVPQASLRYYFESKQRLYIACLELVQTRIFRQMEPVLKDAEALLEDRNADVDEIIERFCALQGALLEALVGGSDGGSIALLILRHDLPSASGAGTLAGDETHIRRLASCFTEMMVRISGNQLDEQSASRVTGLINGQITNVHLRRTRMLDEGWEITRDRMLWLKQVIRKNSAAILQAHRAEGK